MSKINARMSGFHISIDRTELKIDKQKPVMISFEILPSEITPLAESFIDQSYDVYYVGLIGKNDRNVVINQNNAGYNDDLIDAILNEPQRMAVETSRLTGVDLLES